MIHLPTLGAPILDRHPFRQTQTAYTARIFHEEGIDLLHPKLPVLGPPWEVPFEFPLYQAAAAAVMDVGVPEDQALRLTGLASFILTAGLLWLLVCRQAGWLGATVAMGVFLFSPLGIAWGRAALIEYLALALSLGFALAGMRWRADRSGIWFVLALALGCLAALVKITTAVFWILPFALLAVRRDDDPQTGRSGPRPGLCPWHRSPWGCLDASCRRDQGRDGGDGLVDQQRAADLELRHDDAAARARVVGLLENAILLAGGLALPLLRVAGRAVRDRRAPDEVLDLDRCHDRGADPGLLQPLCRP